MISATYEYEDKVKEKGYHYITGVDEAGRGPGAGPVVAAAVRIPDRFIPVLTGKVKDSKKLSPKRREELFDIITNSCDYGIGVIDNKTIDRINILEATKLAMLNAIDDVRYVDYLLVDGTVVLNTDLPQQQIIKGDNLSISIAAASIVAKVTRDEIMRTLHNIYPIYGWDKNKGYLTKIHIDAIKEYGATEFHRKSFNKVK